MGLVDDLIAQFTAQQDRANAANESRFQQGMEIFDRVVAQQEAGGTAQAATEAAIDRARKKSVAQGTQALVTSGLSGTTTAAGLGKKFEEEVGVPARLAAADTQSQRLVQALTAKAGFVERREDTGPSFSDIAGLATSIGAGSAARSTPRTVDNRSHFEVPGSFFGPEATASRAASQSASDTRSAQRRRETEQRATDSASALAAHQARLRQQRLDREAR